MTAPCAAAACADRPVTVFVNPRGAYLLCGRHDGLARQLVALAGDRADGILADVREVTS